MTGNGAGGAIYLLEIRMLFTLTKNATIGSIRFTLVYPMYGGHYGAHLIGSAYKSRIFKYPKFKRSSVRPPVGTSSIL